MLTMRNFYGVLSVKEYYADDPESHVRELLNGRILHGAQFQDPVKSKMPTTYYDENSGLGLTLLNYRRDRPRRVAVVGLGTGTIAAYGRKGDFYGFYELNQNVRTIASDYFSYLRDSAADVQVYMGDARLTMERQPPQGYDVIALDAFSGDAIPVHLLTKEAFELYQKHLKPRGVIAVHISNRHLDLEPVVGEAAKTMGTCVVKVANVDEGGVAEAASDWMLLTSDAAFLQQEALADSAKDVAGSYTPIRLWTDQYSNLFQILR
jgi:spermidine synthase